MHDVSQRTAIGPVVVAVRGPSRSGKTSLCSRLVPAFEARGVRVAWVKRTHHSLDLPEKASGRIWACEPSAMVLHTPGRLQVNLPPGEREVAALIPVLPPDIDVVLLETHAPEELPVLLNAGLEPDGRERVLLRWSLDTVDSDATAAAAAIEALLPADRELDLALRAAMRIHGGHACAGLVLGTRLALHGARTLGVAVPDREKRLLAVVETDRCAVDAIQAVTGCRPGKRTLRLLDYGKLAATLIDQRTGAAVRVAARGDLRERASGAFPREERHARQQEAYLHWPGDELFVVAPASSDVSQYDLPGPPRRRVACVRCGEEVSDGRDIATESGPHCRPCAAAQGATPAKEGAGWR